MKNYLQLVLVSVIAIVMLTGCHNHSSEIISDPEYVQLTVDGQTVNCNAGLSNSPFEGKCLGDFVTADETIFTCIYGSVSVTNGLFQNSGVGVQAIFIMIEGSTVGSGYRADIMYADGVEGGTDNLGSATITQYDTVGGRIKGTFSGTINGKSITGSFNVKRYVDEAMGAYFL